MCSISKKRHRKIDAVFFLKDSSSFLLLHHKGSAGMTTAVTSFHSPFLIFNSDVLSKRLYIQLYKHYKLSTFNFQLITPDPINSSPIYQAANCPSAMACCGSKNSTQSTSSNWCKRALRKGWR